MSAPRFRVDPSSESFVRLIDVVFAVTISSGFNLIVKILETPELSIPVISLILVYATILLSWIGYHQSLSRYPYNRSRWSRFRLASDLFILVLYAYLITSYNSPSKVLGGLAAIYVLYAGNGLFRILEWREDTKVSRPALSVVIAIVFLFFCYLSVLYSADVYIPWVLISASFALVFGYRAIRGRLGHPRLLVVGIDVDGVLGDQVPHVLARLHSQSRAVGLSKEKITDWYFEFEGTNIAKEIEAALMDPSFVMEMPVMRGSVEAIQKLHKTFHVVIATSRPKETETATIKWVNQHFKYHEYVNTREFGKEDLGLDVLVDDNLENVKRFAQSSQTALLFTQPWNLKPDSETQSLIDSGKIVRCNRWEDVDGQLDKMMQVMTARMG